MAKKILLDPGHMKGCNYMAATGYSEGTQMWKLYTYLRPMLEAYGFTVGTTRTSSEDYPGRPGEDNITGRGRMAAGYDLMLSLHTNACGTESVNRPVIIYPVSGKCKDLSEKLGAALQSCMGLQQYQTMQKYNSAGNADYYGVIRGAAQMGVPCLIVEHTFHTNNTMARWLLSDVNLKKVAQCIADTVAGYYGVQVAQKTVEDGWVQDSKGWWYRYEDGTWPANGWLMLDAWYYFDANGYMVADSWIRHTDGCWYYLGSDGRMVTDKQITIDSDGRMVV